MRIQILELPSVVVGDDVQTPFALIIDQAPSFATGERTAELAKLKDACGARAIAAFTETVELVGP